MALLKRSKFDSVRRTLTYSRTHTCNPVSICANHDRWSEWCTSAGTRHLFYWAPRFDASCNLLDIWKECSFECPMSLFNHSDPQWNTVELWLATCQVSTQQDDSMWPHQSGSKWSFILLNLDLCPLFQWQRIHAWQTQGQKVRMLWLTKSFLYDVGRRSKTRPVSYKLGLLWDDFRWTLKNDNVLVEFEKYSVTRDERKRRL